MRRLHGIAGTALGKRANGGSVTEHFRQRYLRVHDGQITTRFDAVDAGAATIQIADDVALIFFRRDVFHFHDRLEQDWFALLETIFHRENRRHFKSELVRIDFVVTAVNDIDFNVDDR